MISPGYLRLQKPLSNPIDCVALIRKISFLYHFNSTFLNLLDRAADGLNVPGNDLICSAQFPHALQGAILLLSERFRGASISGRPDWTRLLDPGAAHG